MALNPKFSTAAINQAANAVLAFRGGGGSSMDVEGDGAARRRNERQELFDLISVA